MDNTNIVETYDLTKIYKLRGKKKEILALNKVNISIKEGEIFGLLGPNGAGKTTTIQILATILQPTSGYATIAGFNILKNPKEAKKRIALMLGSEMIYYRMTGYDNLKFFCKIYKVPNYKNKIYAMAENFGLKEWLNQFVEKYSNGMKMKLALCRTFLLERPLMFLDEPTLGLDVKLKNYIINKLKETKGTIILTSHDMSVIEKVCHRIAFINKGKIIKVGTKEDLKAIMQSEILLEIGINKNLNQLISELEQHRFINDIKKINSGLMISLRERKFYNDLLHIIVDYEITRIKEHEISLEDLFLNLI